MTATHVLDDRFLPIQKEFWLDSVWDVMGQAEESYLAT